jgi:hypothetical protein
VPQPRVLLALLLSAVTIVTLVQCSPRARNLAEFRARCEATGGTVLSAPDHHVCAPADSVLFEDS